MVPSATHDGIHRDLQSLYPAPFIKYLAVTTNIPRLLVHSFVQDLFFLAPFTMDSRVDKVFLMKEIR